MNYNPGKIRGLTIHFKLAAPRNYSTVQAEKFVKTMHRIAAQFCAEGLVDKVLPITTDAKTLRRFACDWLILRVPGQRNISTDMEISPAEGFLFRVNVGEDCEPLWLGLCRYPAKIFHPTHNLPIRRSPAWRFSKTQYASLHGWEHFQRCHCAVVNLLIALGEKTGLRVKISDEGEYWPRRSLGMLRRNVEQMNALVAAAAGKWKDSDDGGRVVSPIFRSKDFERLEAEGASQNEAALLRMHDAVSDALKKYQKK